MTPRTALLAIAMATGIAGCAPPADPVARGRLYFREFACVRCHRIGAEGATYGPDLTYIGFRKTPEWLDRWLKNPHEWKARTVMPNLHLNEDVRVSLVAFLARQQGQAYERTGKPWEKPEYKDDTVHRGEVLFRSLGCAGCHGAEGVGGNPNNNVAGGLIPALTGVSEKYSRDELKEKVRLGAVPAAADPRKPAPMLKMPEWGKVLNDSEMSALADYLMTLKSKGPKADEW